MELSETTLAHLRDEAYAFLAREALLAKLGELERERASVASTRPPFGGLLARKQTREAFARSMRVVDDDELVLRDQLAQINGIVEWLRPVIRKDVSTYLASQSPDYCRLLQIAARIDDWQRSYEPVAELLLAFARDVKAVKTVLASTKKAGSATHELAVLRESAERLSRQHHALQLLEKAALALAPEGLGQTIRFPELPDLQRLSWVGRLAVITPEQAVAEASRVETEVRALIAAPTTPIFKQLAACRDECGRLVEQTLEGYWDQLRAYARQHYVEDRSIAEVIAMLNETYVDSDLRRRQQALTADPFATR